MMRTLALACAFVAVSASLMAHDLVRKPASTFRDHALAGADSLGSHGGTATPAFRQAIPNIPGKNLIAVVVDYAPGAKSPPHRHADSAFVAAYVLSGTIRSKVDDQPARLYSAGDSWFEAPGEHHTISENASTTEPARLLAIFVADTGERVLTRFDQY